MSLIMYICVIAYVGFVLFMVSGLFKHTELDVRSYDTLPNVSVVIAARNEEDHISNLINDLIAQEYPLDKLEVIIVNDRSTDMTLSILNEASDNYAFIKIISIDEPSKEMTPKKNALSKGIESAVGEIIVLTDADYNVAVGMNALSKAPQDKTSNFPRVHKRIIKWWCPFVFLSTQIH